MKRVIGIAAWLLLCISVHAVIAQESWTPEQKEVVAAIDRLSATTAPEGGGAEAYGAVLSPGFTRWTIGSRMVSEKKDWVDGVRAWFDNGWRVTGRDTRDLWISVEGDYAFVRRVVKETYSGPQGETSTGTAALAEVWTRSESGWLLFRVDVHPLDER